MLVLVTSALVATRWMFGKQTPMLQPLHLTLAPLMDRLGALERIVPFKAVMTVCATLMVVTLTPSVWALRISTALE